MTVELVGTGVSRGVAIGPARIVNAGTVEVSERRLRETDLQAEVTRLHLALKSARTQLQELKAQIPSGTPADIAAFIDSHLLMLDDTALNEGVTQLIRQRQCNAEWALKLQRDSLAAAFEAMDDAYLSARRDDVDHVVGRIQRILLDQAPGLEAEALAGSEARILVAEDISPADFVLIQNRGIAGVVTEHGGPLSHTAILARSLNIPAIVGLHGARKALTDGETIIIDGADGRVLAEPDAGALEHYRAKLEREAERRAGLTKLRGVPARTRDGVDIALRANIELPGDIAGVIESGATGVGLYRTEFLYMNRADVPSEDEQLSAYRQVLAGLEGAPMTVRTLDLGADKTVDGAAHAGPVATNPALGLRGIRLCLREPELFRPQLRALLRVAAEGPVRIMVPMVSNLDEVRRTRELIAETAGRLASEGIEHHADVALGAMIEVPAAALAARELVRHVDFLSIGTNDLIQYTLAIDRIDDGVNYLYDPLHPAVLALIRMTIEAGRDANVPVAMCGEMAGDPRYTGLLLALGLTEFSMHPATLLEVKQAVMSCDRAALRERCLEWLKNGDPAALEALLGATENTSA